MTFRELFVKLGFNVDEVSLKEADSTIRNLRDRAFKLVGAIGIGFSLVELNALAEEFNGINDQIRNATRQMGEQQAIQQKILDTANETRTSYGDTAKFVGALVQENKNLFGTADEAAHYAELTAKLFKGAGKSNEDVTSLQEALNVSFAKGVVDTSTIDQLMERAPEAIDLICKELGVAKERLSEMVGEGSVSLDVLRNAFTNNADVINQSFGELDLNISDALLNIRNQWGYWVDQMNSTLGVGKTIAKIMVTGFSKVMEVLKKISAFTTKLVEQLGGFENLLKLIAGTAASIFWAIKGNEIKKFLKSTIGLLTKVDKKLLLAKLKTMAIAAVFLALFLIVEDFVGFMQGKDSLIGSLLENAGVDIDAVRENIQILWDEIKSLLGGLWNFVKSLFTPEFWSSVWNGAKKICLDVWNSISSSLSSLWESLKNTAKSIFESLQAFWQKWGDKIHAFMIKVGQVIGSIVTGILDVVVGLIDILAAIFSGDWEKVWYHLAPIVSKAGDLIAAALKGILKLLLQMIGFSGEEAEERVEQFVQGAIAIFNWLKDGIKAIFEGIRAFWEQWGSQIMAQFGIIWAFFEMTIEAVKTFFQGLIDFITGVFTGNWEQAWEGIKTMFTGIMEGIRATFKTIWDSIYNWFGKKIDAFVKKVQDFTDGIKKKFQGVVDFFGGIGDTIGGFFGNDNLDATVKATTINASTGGGNRTNNVTQNVTTNNTFNGGDPAMQKKGAEVISKQAEDSYEYASRQLARG